MLAASGLHAPQLSETQSACADASEPQPPGAEILRIFFRGFGVFAQRGSEKQKQWGGNETSTPLFSIEIIRETEKKVNMLLKKSICIFKGNHVLCSSKYCHFCATCFIRLVHFLSWQPIAAHISNSKFIKKKIINIRSGKQPWKTSSGLPLSWL